MQAGCACIINRVEDILVTEDGRQPDAEAQAGRALRRLRLARQWSQEEAAGRMRAYGYDFHQTTIAKIEAAQRPLRVRELADFAALYGVEIQELVYPPSGSLTEVNQEIAELESRRMRVQEEISRNQELLGAAEYELHERRKRYQENAAAAAVLEGRLSALQAEREKLISWESDDAPAPAEHGVRTTDLVTDGISDQPMSGGKRSSASPTLTNLADLGEMHLLAMTAPDLEIFQNLAIADRIAQWAQVAVFVVRVALGEAHARELAPGTPGRSSPAPPRPDEIAPDLADSWDSVAWRIGKLREWAAGTAS
jgi:transcriptional regulator with XRE-family HTH domain